jgi:hypothetical protein
LAAPLNFGICAERAFKSIDRASFFQEVREFMSASLTADMSKAMSQIKLAASRALTPPSAPD